MSDGRGGGSNFIRFPKAVMAYDNFMASSLDQICSMVFKLCSW